MKLDQSSVMFNVTIHFIKETFLTLYVGGFRSVLHLKIIINQTVDLFKALANY